MNLSYDRLVLIHSSKLGEVSTGYVVSDGIILTCLHGLVRTESEALVGSDVTARVRIGAARQPERKSDGLAFGQTSQTETDDEGFLAARLVWPPPDAPANKVDLALLRVDLRELPENCRVSKQGGATLDVRRSDFNGRSAGFPEFSADKNTSSAARRQACDIVKLTTTGFDDNKQLPTHTYAESRPLCVQYGAPVRDVAIDRKTKHGAVAAKPRPTGWAGMSGAPVFGNDPKGLLGVVQVRGDARLKDDVLRYFPFAAMKGALQEDAVAQFWEISGLVPPREPQAFDRREVLLEKLDYLTRTQESEWFAEVTAALEEAKEAAAQCFMIMGHYEDDLTQCVNYLLRQARQDIPGGDATYQTFICAGLPEGTDKDGPEMQEVDVEDRAKTVSRDILSGYHVPEAEVRKMNRAARLQRIREEISDGSAARVWVLEHRGDSLTDGCLVLAQRLAVLLASLPKLSPPALVFLLMQTGYTQGAERVEFSEKIKRVRRMIQPTLAIDLRMGEVTRFDQDSIEPLMDFEGSDDDKRLAWIKMLADDKWLVSETGFTSRPMMSGRGKLAAIRATDVDRWVQEFDGSTISLTERQKELLREAFEARDLPAQIAKKALENHPVFNEFGEDGV